MSATGQDRMVPGSKVDIRKLEKVDGRFPVDIILYFEEDLARSSTYANDCEQFKEYPEENRPFISLAAFMKFQREMNPSFDQALSAVPMRVEVIACEEQPTGKPVVKCLLPFLDEMESD